MNQPSAPRFGVTAMTFHWITAILVLTAFIFGPGGSELRVYLPARDFERQLHETLGLCVFFLSLLRLAWSVVDTRPPALPSTPWMELAAKGMQGALYLLLFAVPLTAILGAWLEGHPVGLLGGWQIASPLATAHDLGVGIAEVHTWLGDAILWLAGAHAGAAIYHHAVLKDRVLTMMLPRWLPFQR